MNLHRLVIAAACFVSGTLLGALAFGHQPTVAAFQAGNGTVIEQTAYYAKPGLANGVYRHRLHASDVREKLGLPRGRVWRRTGGEGDLPDVIWQLEYSDQDALRRDLDARAKSAEFTQVRSVMNTLLARFSRGFYQPAVPNNLAVGKNSDSTEAKDAELELLARWMTGDFDTFAQVAADETAKTTYRHDKVILRLRPVRIAGFFDNGASKTFYLEQAQADTPAQPYRQGVYLLTRFDGKIINRTYRIRDAAKVVGAHADPKLLKLITADQLTPVEGCEVTFTKVSDVLYRGVMGEGKTCKSTRRGATHMVSQGELTPSATITLDQGFDDDGKHKWGPPPGVIGHIFVKRQQ